MVVKQFFRKYFFKVESIIENEEKIRLNTIEKHNDLQILNNRNCEKFMHNRNKFKHKLIIHGPIIIDF